MEKPQAISPSIQAVHLEGSATEEEGEGERIYFDAYLVHHPEKKCVLYAESKSTILNGPVEGPYFEECLKKLTVS